MSKIKNSLIFKAFLMLVMGVMLFSLIPVNVYATDTKETDGLYIDGKKIATIYYGETPLTRGYFDPDPFTFSNYMNGNTKYYDGDWMALEVSATSTAGLIRLHIDLFTYNTNTHHDCSIWTNGYTNKFDWMSLGTSGGSSADNYYFVESPYTSAVNTVDVKSYSWY